MEQLLFRPALAADAPRIMQIIRQAQAQMRALGSDQWQDGYPAPSDIDRDIAAGVGYVLAHAGETEAIAYGAILFDGEPAYDAIEGQWLTVGPYAVLHRLAVADGHKRQGIAGEFMRRTERLARERGTGSFRVDTHRDNGYMLRLIERHGFVRCGIVRYRSGERIAFEKILE